MIESTECCAMHNKLKPSFGSCSISIFDGCGACCSNCPDWDYEEDEDWDYEEDED